MKKRWKTYAAGVAGLAVLAGAADYGFYYFETGRYVEGTDDAYLKADYTTIAPKVSGYIGQVLVDDNQPVKAGQVLARIDDRDLKTALDQAKADLDAANAAIGNIDAQIEMQQALVAQAGADIGATAAGLNFAQQDDKRYKELVASGAATVQRVQQAEASLRQQSAQLEHAHAGLAAATQKVAVLKTERVQAETQLERAKAIETQAELNLSYATITAPIDGSVGARSVRVGQFVQAGTQLMAVVPLQSVYVVANFKETQLAHMRDGAAATVEVDSFPGAVIHGHVDSLSPASGLEFALLPPDNATGNFTKIVQRIPVKIVLDKGDPLVGRLRPGMSVEADIDTRTGTVTQPADAPAVADAGAAANVAAN